MKRLAHRLTAFMVEALNVAVLVLELLLEYLEIYMYVMVCSLPVCRYSMVWHWKTAPKVVLYVYMAKAHVCTVVLCLVSGE